MVAVNIPVNSKVSTLNPSQIDNLFTDGSSSNDILLWISAIALILALGSLFYVKVPKDYKNYQYILIVALAVSTLVLFLNKSKFGNTTNTTKLKFGNTTIKKSTFGSIVNTQEAWVAQGNTGYMVGGNWILYFDTTIQDFNNPSMVTGYTGPIRWLFNCSSKSFNIKNLTPDTSTLTLPPRSILSVAAYENLNTTVLNKNNKVFREIIFDNEYLTVVLLHTDKNSAGVATNTYICFTGAESPYGELFLKMMSIGNYITISPKLVTCKNLYNTETVTFKKLGSDCINIDGITDFTGNNSYIRDLMNNLRMKIINYTTYDYIMKYKVSAYGEKPTTTSKPDLTQPQRVKKNIDGGTGEVFIKTFSDMVIPALGGETILLSDNNFYSENGEWRFEIDRDNDNVMLGKMKFFDIPDGGIIVTDVTDRVATIQSIIGIKNNKNNNN